MNVILMSHPSRWESVVNLDKQIKSQGATTTRIWDTDNTEWNTGKNCLLEAKEWEGYSLILQDDSIIGNHFIDNAQKAIDQCPEPGALISMYVGTSRPFKNAVQKAIDRAIEEKATWLTSSTLHWGVGIAIHSDYIPYLLKYVRNSTLPYDQRIGSYFKHLKRKIYYTFPSIVDHADEQSLIKKVHNYPRVAHEYSDNVLEFKGGTVAI